MAYVVFDLLELEGAALLDDAVVAAPRARWPSLLDDHVGEVRLSTRLRRRRGAARSRARAQGLGIVAKRRDSRYRPGVVSDDWRLLS